MLVTPEKAILFTDPRFEIQAAQEVACEVRIAKGPLVLDVAGDDQAARVEAHRIRAGAHDLRRFRIV